MYLTRIVVFLLWYLTSKILHTTDSFLWTQQYKQNNNLESSNGRNVSVHKQQQTITQTNQIYACLIGCIPLSTMWTRQWGYLCRRRWWFSLWRMRWNHWTSGKYCDVVEVKALTIFGTVLVAVLCDNELPESIWFYELVGSLVVFDFLFLVMCFDRVLEAAGVNPKAR